MYVPRPTLPHIRQEIHMKGLDLIIFNIEDTHHLVISLLIHLLQDIKVSINDPLNFIYYFLGLWFLASF